MIKSTHIIRNEFQLERLVKVMRANYSEWENKTPLLITVEKYKGNRSVAQNALYWMWVTIVSRETGYTKKELHYMFRDGLLGYEEAITVHGEIKELLISTTDLNTAQFTQYLNDIEYAVGGIVVLPHPDDLYDEAIKHAA